MARIRVLLVDDHTLVRQGMRRMLEVDKEMEVVGECGDGASAIQLVDELKPDVTVMDLAIPAPDGIEATRTITTADKSAKILILTMSTDDVAVRRSLKAGARGYLMKDSEDLVRAVKQIARGQSFFSPAAARLLSGDYASNGTGKQVEDNLHRLTERELEVLRLIADGKTNKDIAAMLSVSVNTIETHRKHIMEKLDLHNTADIVRFAVRKNVVS
jgi:two-component system, NarL family, response regulator NreC